MLYSGEIEDWCGHQSDQLLSTANSPSAITIVLIKSARISQEESPNLSHTHTFVLLFLNVKFTGANAPNLNAQLPDPFDQIILYHGCCLLCYEVLFQYSQLAMVGGWYHTAYMLGSAMWILYAAYSIPRNINCVPPGFTTHRILVACGKGSCALRRR